MSNQPFAKALRFLLPVALISAILAGCGSNPVQDDLIHYINEEVLPLADEENAITGAYESVTGENYVDDESLYAELETLIPKYRDYVAKIEEINPETDEVKELHELYIAASNKQYNAMVQISAALENQDVNLVSEANGKLDEARSGMREYRNRLEALAKEHDVEFEK